MKCGWNSTQGTSEQNSKCGWNTRKEVVQGTWEQNSKCDWNTRKVAKLMCFWMEGTSLLKGKHSRPSDGKKNELGNGLFNAERNELGNGLFKVDLLLDTYYWYILEIEDGQSSNYEHPSFPRFSLVRGHVFSVLVVFRNICWDPFRGFMIYFV